VVELDAVVFDAYGTLFDIDALVPQCESLWPGKGRALVDLWRAKQLQYSWLRSLMANYVDFDVITADAMVAACNVLGLSGDAARVGSFLKIFQTLQAFPEVTAVLKALGRRKRVILSNGSPAMLEATVRNNGLSGDVDLILSADAVKVYKPDPRVYQLVVDKLEIEKERIAFVSSNGWDICGAKRFGFRVYWVNRMGSPMDELGIVPDHVLSSLADLPGALSAKRPVGTTT
jgi:2-haloacid dehalogenase